MASTTCSLAVVAITLQDIDAAAQLARQLGLPLLLPDIDLAACSEHEAVLIVGGSGLALQQTHPGTSGGKAAGAISVDFGNSAMRYRRRTGHNELLGKAVGTGKKEDLRVLDATAGLGTDSFVLADLGCRVVLCEREPVIAAMLHWGMEAAAHSDDSWLQEVIGRMRLHCGDARDLPLASALPVDVIYLDPMFPPRGKSAAVKKEMALLQLLLQPRETQEDARQLLLWALGQDVARVVVKRPPRAPSLAALQPSHSIAGKAVRYDVYVRRSLLA